jgi:hypothetical protein
LRSSADLNRTRSRAGGLKISGLTSLVDVLEDRVLLASDFGDAPTPYPVTLADNGARHTVTGPKLGLTVDSESNGTNSANSDADGADEDGIVFGPVLVGNNNASVTVKVRNAAHGTKLDAWIDFNRDGDWNDAGEKIFDSVQVYNNTDQNYYFQVPVNAVPGITFSRFRISSAGGLAPTGEAPDGEVEDHRVTIGLAVPAITSPVANATVDVTGTSRVTFQWTAAAQAVNYEIWVRSHNYLAQSEFHRTIVSGTTYTPDVDFGAGKYTVWVRTIGSNNTLSAWSTARPFTVVTKTTIVPMTKMQPTALPTISWNPAPGAESYKIWISNLSTKQSPVIHQTGLTQTSFTPTAALPIGVYRVWIAAVSANATAGWSAPVDFQIAPAPIPQPMTPTFARNTFSWSSVVGATSYEVQLRNLKTGETVFTQSTSGTSLTSSVALLAGVQYRWWVRAKSAQNVNSLWSGPTNFYANGQTTVLTPTGSSSDKTPTFTWKAVEGAARYEIIVTRTDGTIPSINKKDVTTTSYTPTANLATGTYRVWVRAVSVNGAFSSWSLPLTFTITMNEADTQESSEIPQLLASDIDSALQDYPAEMMMTTSETRSMPIDDHAAVEFQNDDDSRPAETPFPAALLEAPPMPTPIVDLIDVAIYAWVQRSADLS